MSQCMNALTDKVYTKHAHCDMHSIPWPHYSTTIPIYTSSSKCACMALLVFVICQDAIPYNVTFNCEYLI